MSLAKTLNGGKQSLKVHINDIRANPNNDYEINEDEVISLSLSIEKYGAIKGLIKGCIRLLRCHPPNGGRDEP